MSRWIAVRFRPSGAPAVYFGPFDSFEIALDWARAHDLAVALIELTDPDSDRSTWS